MFLLFEVPFDNLIDVFRRTGDSRRGRWIIQDHFPHIIEHFREFLQIGISEGLRITDDRQDGIEKADMLRQFRLLRLFHLPLTVKVEHVVFRGLQKVRIAGHLLSAQPLDAFIFQDIDEVPDDAVRLRRHLGEVRIFQVASLVDGESHEGVDLLAIREVGIVEDPRGQVHHFRIRAVRFG